jgi:hypothetical protein
MKYFLITILFFQIGFFRAQGAKINISVDSRIESLVKKQGTAIPPAVNPMIYGYRVQLYFDSDKTTVDEMRVRFIQSMPKIDTYIEFNTPNFVLKVGDFRTMLEAEKIRDKSMADFPTSFIVKEYVNLPRIDRD